MADLLRRRRRGGRARRAEGARPFLWVWDRVVGPSTITEAHNYASCLGRLNRYAEVKTLLSHLIPVARRVLGDCNDRTLQMRYGYAWALYRKDGATLDDLRESVTMLEDTARIRRRVFGAAHPTTTNIEKCLKSVRAVLRANEERLP